MTEGGSGQGQSGYTLVEVIVAILLLSTVFLGITGSIFTVSRATATNKRVQAIDTALVSYAGILRDTDKKPPPDDTQYKMPYRPCTTAGAAGSDALAPLYEADALAMTATTGAAGATDAWRKPDGMVIDIVDVDAWDAVSAKWVDHCAVPDKGAQRISYTVLMGGTTRSGETVKRYPGPSS